MLYHTCSPDASPQGEDNDDKSFLPFAKRSRTVSRCRFETEDSYPIAQRRASFPLHSREALSHCIPGHPDPAALQGVQYTSEFWNRPYQQPHTHWMERYEEGSPMLLSGSAVHRPNSQLGAVTGNALDRSTWSRGLERLPSPSELCGRKQNRAVRKRRHSGRVMAVSHHLEDLKKKQNNIDQLKQLQWGGYRTATSSERVEEAKVDLVLHDIPEETVQYLSSPFSLVPPPPSPPPDYGEGSFFSSNSLSTSLQLIPPQLDSNIQECCFSLGESAVVPRVVAEADRGMLSVGFVSRGDRWEFPQPCEE
ncbi:protein INCA1 isoform X2 [Latimeria chalumnae]|nr:PREDICTED: protein INCA1 isoform X2 [Latimeria chalumnae]XP_014346162.1 PREDICTED: protein INCA1 isoform X2 [Latimeria chalumnae]|eukprot:XP_005999868.1 PREDICTED: protein INCA1 isoform X2 [Latimeria chalumnae]